MFVFFGGGGGWGVRGGYLTVLKVPWNPFVICKMTTIHVIANSLTQHKCAKDCSCIEMIALHHAAQQALR